MAGPTPKHSTPTELQPKVVNVTEVLEATALITGANGQDGTYLVEALLADGNDVHGLCHSVDGARRLREKFPKVHTHVGDLADADGLRTIVDTVQPTHLYNLAGNTSVARSWEFPTETADVLGVGAVRLLDAAWRLQERRGTPVRFLQASSAEIFGETSEGIQNELTLVAPVTPYGAAKAFAHQMVGVYRARGMFTSAAILYNHESPRRPPTFVARKISTEVARISLGLSDQLFLGNIDVYRDWGYAPDYVDAMMRILAAPRAQDYVVATGVAHSVREFVAAAFDHVGIAEWESYVTIDPSLYRPADPKKLVGDPGRLRAIGWQPTVDFTALVQLMVDADLKLLS
jgi:GDPmannose 4,6-dehydratase